MTEESRQQRHENDEQRREVDARQVLAVRVVGSGVRRIRPDRVRDRRRGVVCGSVREFQLVRVAESPVAEEESHRDQHGG